MNKSSKNSGFVAILLVVLVLALLVLGGVFYYTNIRNSSQNVSQTPEKTVEVSPVPEAQLQKEVDNLDLGDLDSEFKEIDSGIQNL